MDTKLKLNSKKRVIENQKYEEYWKCTLALTDFNSIQFIRTLTMIIEHIDKYKLDEYTPEELIVNMKVNRKQFKQEVAHYQELANKIFSIFPNDSEDNSSTRKQINTFVKLGFIKPYLRGYVSAAKDYINPKISIKERRRIFSDTVYQYSSFNSSATKDDSSANQIKFLINTLLNKNDKKIDIDELLGIMQMDVKNQKFANEKMILQNKNWALHIDFFTRKYNQLSHLKSVLSNMSLFEVVEQPKEKEFLICLPENVAILLPEHGDTTRDKYRYGVMRKAVLEESVRIYGKEVSWYSKEESRSLVVSHIYASADALRSWDTDAAYDPNNALLLKPGDEDDYFDKYLMTFDKNGVPIFSEQVRQDVVDMHSKNKDIYKLDEEILNTQRLNYILTYHNSKFREKNAVK